MKRMLGIAVILCSLSLSAFAAKNTKEVTFSQDTKVGSTQVPAGVYKVSWTGTGSNVQIAVVKGRKTIASSPAKLVPAKNNFVGLSTSTIGGVEVLDSIQMDDFNLVLTGGQPSGQQEQPAD